MSKIKSVCELICNDWNNGKTISEIIEHCYSVSGVQLSERTVVNTLIDWYSEVMDFKTWDTQEERKL